ncbi:uncharacterized protein AB675_8180 [Cyphellophora attinorum]|uniref:Enoyl reductase (ER) domain-containing protein n=1 Tax=Cyphellophora attinorum TaxID=1664694 RepID=A0A0N1H5R0_9EURO|nr:uncharacterized protein AB675_8180 [Phialophora attinorum]KPI41164.1 hypothetical protein AB675_8180 [Phialophora attinorum]
METITIPHRPCSPLYLAIETSYPDPEPTPNSTTVSIKAFGINHAEYFLLGKGGGHHGWLGETIQGGCAEKVNVPDGNVVLLEEAGNGINEEGVGGLSWAEVAAIPKNHATAWSVVSQNLEVKAGDRDFVRGVSTAVGTVTLSLAAKSIDLGAEGAILEGPGPSARPKEKGVVFDGVLDLIDNSVLLDSLEIPRRGGRVCQAGLLGGLGRIEVNPFSDMPSGVHLSFFGSFVYGMQWFPLSDVPLAGIVRDVAKGKWDAKPSEVFSFEEIGEAHRHMEEGSAGGKMVVVV